MCTDKYCTDRAHAYVYIYMYMCVCIRRHTNEYTCIHKQPDKCVYIHTYIHAYIYAYMYTCIHTCVRTYVHTYIRTYIHTYTYIHVRTQTCLVEKLFKFANLPASDAELPCHKLWLESA